MTYMPTDDRDDPCPECEGELDRHGYCTLDCGYSEREHVEHWVADHTYVPDGNEDC